MCNSTTFAEHYCTDARQSLNISNIKIVVQIIQKFVVDQHIYTKKLI